MMACADYGQYPLFLLVAGFGILFLISVSVLIDTTIKLKIIDNTLSFIGSNTLSVFAVQKPVIKAFAKIFSIVPIYSSLALIITCIGTLIICCGAAKFINRYIPVMAGRPTT